jgi:RNA polymerase sigma factor (sigma-70 family)
MPEQRDGELLSEFARTGDSAAFAQIVRRHRAWLSAAAARRVRDTELADDVTQAVFSVLTQKAKSIAVQDRENLNGWLFHVMHFACVRAQRDQKRRRRNEADAASLRESWRTHDGPPPGDLLALLEDSISALPADEREMVTRRFYRRQTFDQIGKATSTSSEAARKRVSRALIKLRNTMIRDGIDVIPESLLGQSSAPIVSTTATDQPSSDHPRAQSISQGAITMVEEAKDLGFAVMSAEFFVQDVESNIDFFEKLGFLRRYVEPPDPMGRVPRASLRGGNGRIWLRRADPSDGTRPTPGVVLYFWIDGGDEGLRNHRDRIAARGVPVSPFFDDIGLRNFTVTTPDGYQIGFFTQYR